MFTLLLMLIIAYLLGSISSAIIICRLQGLPDPRTQGSENAGATNVLRFADKKTAAMVFAGDFFKGFIAVILARFFGLTGGSLAWVLLAVVIGHIFPVFFNFKGGKGIATAFGGLLALSWPIAIVAALVWTGIAYVYRYSS